MTKSHPANILYYLSVAIFVLAVSSFVLVRRDLAKEAEAQAAGLNVGGRITVVTPASPSCPEPPQAFPCVCNTYHTTVMAAGMSLCPVICPAMTPPILPITGLPINPSMAGYALLGLYTVCYPVAESMNWGTSLMPAGL